MDNGNEDQDYDAIQKVIRRARFARDVALGEVIGQVCTMVSRAISVAMSRHRLPPDREHA